MGCSLGDGHPGSRPLGGYPGIGRAHVSIADVSPVPPAAGSMGGALAGRTDWRRWVGMEGSRSLSWWGCRVPCHLFCSTGVHCPCSAAADASRDHLLAALCVLT